MSTNYTAYTIIGSLVRDSMFYKDVERDPHERCETRGPGPRCSTCGEALDGTELVHVPIEGYEGPGGKGVEYHGLICGLHVIRARTAEGERYFVIGAIGRCRDYNYSDSGVVSKMRCDVAFIADAEERVRVALSKAGLWDQDKFGIWTVLHCSY